MSPWPLARAPMLVVTPRDERHGALISADLRHAGCRVVIEPSGLALLAGIAELRPDAVILDVELEDADGPAVCRRLRERRLLPVLFVTEQGDLPTRLRCFEAGADDVLTAPYHAAELRARLAATLRRSLPAARLDDGVLVCGPLRLDPDAHLAWCDGRALALTPIEFSLLRAMMERPDRAVSRTVLLDAAWGVDFIPGSNVVDRHLASLRRKLGDGAGCIETLPHVGYRLRGGFASSLRHVASGRGHDPVLRTA